MVGMTMIARVADGLPLAASMEEENDRDLAEYKMQAKLLFKQLSDASPARLSISTGRLCFHYMIELGVCYLVLCEPTYPKSMAFAYLNDLQKDFNAAYGNEVGTAARPYAFIGFDTVIQKTKRRYADTRNTTGVNQLNAELQDVQRVMTQNIQEIIGRGEKLEKIGDMAYEMKEQSKRYLKDAKYANLMEKYRKYVPLAILLFIIIFVAYVRIYWF